MEKVFKLNDGLDIYKVHIEELREQDKNARVMNSEKFERLTSNIKKDGVLESLPLGVLNEKSEIEIISGHHRTRAARAAGLSEIYVMAYNELGKDKIKSKQLSHNAIQGLDNEQVLKEIYEEIQSTEEKISSAVNIEELNSKLSDLKPDEIVFPLDYKVVNLVFLENDKKEFDKVIDMLQDEDVYIIDKGIYNKFVEAIEKTKKTYNIRAVTTAITKMAEIIEGIWEDRQNTEKK